MSCNLTSRSVLTAVVLALCCWSTPAANAALVSWGSWTAVTDNTAIQTLAGYTTIEGVNFNGSTTLISNGSQNVNFIGIAQNASGLTAGITVGSTGFAFQSTGSGNSNVVSAVGAPQTWATVLDRVIGDDNNSASINLSGLTIGDSYYVQFFSNTPDPNINGTTKLSSGGVDSPTFGSPHASGATRYIIGTFTADATTQSFAVTGVEPSFSALVIGSAPAIPEPSTFALLGMSIVGLSAYAWRKTK